MRRTLMPGLLLVLASVLVVLISSTLELELEPVALLGIALGAVLALVPDRTGPVRLAGFAAGLAIVWIGYLLRAALLPDSTGGRAVFVGGAILACVLVAALAKDRLALWSLLLGAAAVAGAFELTYTSAPPEVAGNSLSAVTALVLTVAVGFLAASALAPAAPAATSPRAAAEPRETDDNPLDDFMTEKAH